MIPRYYIVTLTTQWCVTRRDRVKIQQSGAVRRRVIHQSIVVARPPAGMKGDMEINFNPTETGNIKMCD